MDFETLMQSRSISLHEVFPTLSFSEIAIPDMSVRGHFFDEDPEHENLAKAAKRLAIFQEHHPNALLANGYLEERSFYNTKRFQRTQNGRTEYRNIHLGTDFWTPSRTPVHAPFDGTVIISHDNNFHKDYGPLLIVSHQTNKTTWYTLYGHLSKDSLSLSPAGRLIKQGDLIGYLGDETENGHWLPHLHFQIITDLLGATKNYNGVAFPSEIELWKKRCPDPDLLFEESLH